MCGIAGIVGNRVTGIETHLRSMSAALVHRGPDDAGECVWAKTERTPQTGFVHRRLSIIDLTNAGHEPMVTPDGRYSINYNGEVYNYRELRNELQAEGVQFSSQTDTEVVLQLYARRGPQILKLLRGMFAFAIRDNQSGEVFIARDHLGIKPLYFYFKNDLFIFASEVRALLESNLVPRRLSRAGLASYLQRGSVTAPLTMVEGVQSLAPGHYATIGAKADGSLNFTQKSFIDEWLTPRAPEGLTRADATRELYEALKESVSMHLVSDVPLAPFLSGGIDSSAIVALMSEVSREQPKTFSVVFEEQKFSEAKYARLIADRFNTDHREIRLSEDRLYQMLPGAIESMDQPTMDGINTFVVSKAVKQAGITVALSGLGGDELFAGYPTFRRAVKMRSLPRVPASMRKGVAAVGAKVLNGSTQQRKLWQLLQSDAGAAATCDVSRQLLSDDEIQSLLSNGDEFKSPGASALPTDGPEVDTINAVSRCELTGYMSNTLLRDTDSMSMAHSLEVRVPFLDPEVVRFVLSLPGEWKLNGGKPKPLLLDALGDLLPPEIVNRPKMGFTLPFENWMQSRLREEIGATFDNANLFNSIGIEPKAAREVWQKFLTAPQKVGWSRPWALYVLSKWCAQHRVTV